LPFKGVGNTAHKQEGEGWSEGKKKAKNVIKENLRDNNR